MELFLRKAAEAIIAAAKGNEEVLQGLFAGHEGELLRRPAEPNVRTPLHDACAVDNLIFVKTLLTWIPESAGEKDADDLSPLHIAAARGHVEIAKELVRGRQPLCLVEGPDGKIPLHYAIENGKVDVMRELLSVSPESVEKTTAWEETGLHLAAAQGHVEIAKELVKGRQHLCLVKGPDGKIPLHYAIENGEVDVMKELLSVSPVSIKETTARKETGLHLAVKNDMDEEAFVELVKHLKQQNMEQVINLKDNNGNTALHLAVAEKNSQVVKFMLDKHARRYMVVDVNARNNYDQTPLDLVGREEGDRAIKEMLNAVGAKQGRGRHSSLVLEGESRADIRNALLVVAGLIVNATYQSVLQPPHFKTKVDKTLTEGFHASYASYMTGFFGRDLAYIVFITGNTFALLVSVQMIICLTRDLSVRLPMLLSMTLMVQTYYCHTYYLPFGTQETAGPFGTQETAGTEETAVTQGKEFGLINAELLSVLPLMIPILLLLFQRPLARPLEFYLEKLSQFDHLRDMYHI